MVETKVKGYFITEDGRVWSSKSGRFLKPCKSSSGYLKVSLGSKHKNVSIHRLVAFAFVAGYEDGLEVNHIDGNKHNNHSSNLEWVTKSQNHKHKHSVLGKTVRGSSVSSSKLHELDVKEIKRCIEQGEPLTNISQRFGVHIVTIHDISKGKTWKHIGVDYIAK